MIFLLKLPPILGTFIAVLISLTFTCVLFITAHIFLRGKRPDETKVFAQQMALRIGTMHVLVVALVFSILTGELIKLYKLLIKIKADELIRSEEQKLAGELPQK